VRSDIGATLSIRGEPLNQSGTFEIRALEGSVLVEGEAVSESGKVPAPRSETLRFLSSILPYTSADWEKLSIFLNFLVSKLPAPVEEDLSKGILEAIDMDSYRVEKRAVVKIQLPDADAEIEPVPTTGGGYKPEPELDRLSNILKVFNDQFGNIPWTDTDRVHKLITEDIPNLHEGCDLRARIDGRPRL
jgi:type I restriction enzyme R subunit